MCVGLVFLVKTYRSLFMTMDVNKSDANTNRNGSRSTDGWDVDSGLTDTNTASNNNSDNNSNNNHNNNSDNNTNEHSSVLSDIASTPTSCASDTSTKSNNNRTTLPVNPYRKPTSSATSTNSNNNRTKLPVNPYRKPTSSATSTNSNNNRTKLPVNPYRKPTSSATSTNSTNCRSTKLPVNPYRKPTSSATSTNSTNCRSTKLPVNPYRKDISSATSTNSNNNRVTLPVNPYRKPTSFVSYTAYNNNRAVNPYRKKLTYGPRTLKTNKLLKSCLRVPEYYSTPKNGSGAFCPGFNLAKKEGGGEMVLKRLKIRPQKKVTFHWSSKIKPGVYVGNVIKSSGKKNSKVKLTEEKDVVVIDEESMCDDMEVCAVGGGASGDGSKGIRDGGRARDEDRDKEIANRRAWDEHEYKLYMEGKSNNPPGKGK